MLGDFNVLMGSGTGRGDDVWSHVRRRFGIGMMNDAGEELLSFLSLFGARVYNTCFRKKKIHKVIWRHTRSQ